MDANQSASVIAYPSGARRDDKTGKPAMHLIYWPFVDSLAMHLGSKAPHYGERNWEKGLPRDSIIAGLLRHASLLAQGDESEDHTMGIAFAAMAYFHHREKGLI